MINVISQDEQLMLAHCMNFSINFSKRKSTTNRSVIRFKNCEHFKFKTINLKVELQDPLPLIDLGEVGITWNLFHEMSCNFAVACLDFKFSFINK